MPQLYHARYKLEDQTDKTDTKIYEAFARGKFKNEEITPLVGDKVEIEITDEEKNVANVD